MLIARSRLNLLLAIECLIIIFTFLSCVDITSSPSVLIQKATKYNYQIKNTYIHDNNAFTEGLAFNNGFLFEGTGLNGSSSIRKVDLETGKVVQIQNISDQYFGEGITVYDNKLFQLTWKSKIGFIYDEPSFKPLGEFNYPFEGWGITHDAKYLIASDGTSKLRFLNPSTIKPIKEIDIHDEQMPVTGINELEYVDNKIYANIWPTDNIAIIDASNGLVTGWIDLSGILSTQEYNRKVDVLNGIAYDATHDRLFITGKYWPVLFEIKLVTR